MTPIKYIPLPVDRSSNLRLLFLRSDLGRAGVMDYYDLITLMAQQENLALPYDGSEKRLKQLARIIGTNVNRLALVITNYHLFRIEPGCLSCPWLDRLYGQIVGATPEELDHIDPPTGLWRYGLPRKKRTGRITEPIEVGRPVLPGRRRPNKHIRNFRSLQEIQQRRAVAARPEAQADGSSEDLLLDETIASYPEAHPGYADLPDKALDELYDTLGEDADQFDDKFTQSTESEPFPEEDFEDYFGYYYQEGISQQLAVQRNPKALFPFELCGGIIGGKEKKTNSKQKLEREKRDAETTVSAEELEGSSRGALLAPDPELDLGDELTDAPRTAPEDAARTNRDAEATKAYSRGWGQRGSSPGSGGSARPIIHFVTDGAGGGTDDPTEGLVIHLTDPEDEPEGGKSATQPAEDENTTSEDEPASEGQPAHGETHETTPSQRMQSLRQLSREERVRERKRLIEEAQRRAAAPPAKPRVSRSERLRQLEEGIMRLWNEQVAASTRIPRLNKLNDQRRRHIRARLSILPGATPQEHLESCSQLFQRILRSHFLTEQFRGFSFDWLFGSEGNMLKVLEGNYDDRRGGDSPAHTGTTAEAGGAMHAGLSAASAPRPRGGRAGAPSDEFEGIISPETDVETLKGATERRQDELFREGMKRLEAAGVMPSAEERERSEQAQQADYREQLARQRSSDPFDPDFAPSYSPTEDTSQHADIVRQVAPETEARESEHPTEGSHGPSADEWVDY